MEHRIFSALRFLSLICCIAILPSLLNAEASEDEARSIVERFIAKQRVDSEMAFIRMDMMADGKRVSQRRMLALYKHQEDGSTDYILRLIRPEDVEGVTVLAQVKPEKKPTYSLYLPAIGKSRPLQDASQAAPFLGSDFSFADLVREIPGSQVYTLQPRAFIQGTDCQVVRATPIDGAGPYAFRDLYISEENSRLYQTDYYDKEGKLFKVLALYGYESGEIVGNSTRPYRSVMTTLKNDTITVFTVITGRINDPFETIEFSDSFIENWTESAVDDFMFSLELTLDEFNP